MYDVTSELSFINLRNWMLSVRVSEWMRVATKLFAKSF